MCCCFLGGGGGDGITDLFLVKLLNTRDVILWWFVAVVVGFLFVVYVCVCVSNLVSLLTDLTWHQFLT